MADPNVRRDGASLGTDKAIQKRRRARANAVPFRVLVCGGRDYNNRDHIHNVLCDLDAERGPITCVIHGDATGADHEGMIWAQMMASARPCTHAPFVPEWEKYGKAAGPMRNQRMIDQGKPDVVLAFPGGRGTADMVKRAKEAGIEVIEVADSRDTGGRDAD